MVIRVNISNPESGQSQSLGNGADRQCPLPHSGQRARRHELDSIVNMIFKRLVGYQNQIILNDKRRQFLQLLLPEHGRRRIVGMADQHHLRLRRQPLFKLFHSGLISVLLIERHRNRLRAQELCI